MFYKNQLAFEVFTLMLNAIFYPFLTHSANNSFDLLNSNTDFNPSLLILTIKTLCVHPSRFCVQQLGPIQ